MRFLVDGYNVTMADDATRRLRPEDQRLALVRRLAARGRELLGPGDITVVFDKGHLADDIGMHGVDVLFSRDRTADDVIADLAERDAGDVTVVTADRELRHRVRERAGRRTEVLPSSTLWESAPNARAKRRTGRQHPHGGLPKGHEKITRELEERWLDHDEED
jgi:predicted RNA-binding protein with PIN domain